MGYGNLEGVLIGQAGSEKRTLTDTRALRQAVVNSLTASNADGVARLKCARVPGEAETHVIQPDSESKMSVLWGKKKKESHKQREIANSGSKSCHSDKWHFTLQ